MAMYNITPAPYIVELDQHQLGGALQDVLLDTTGRRSVPNIMIKGQSIGGGDDVAALHDQGVLADLIRNKAGKSVTQVTLKQG
jgi:glutaredoxin